MPQNYGRSPVGIFGADKPTIFFQHSGFSHNFEAFLSASSLHVAELRSGNSSTQSSSADMAFDISDFICRLHQWNPSIAVPQRRRRPLPKPDFLEVN